MARVDDVLLTFAAPVIDFEFGDTVVLLIEGHDPISATATLTPEKRIRRDEGREVRTVRERKVTITSGLGLGFDSLNSAKLSTIVVVGAMQYAVEDVAMSERGVTYSLVRSSRQELHRDGTYGRR